MSWLHYNGKTNLHIVSSNFKTIFYIVGAVVSKGQVVQSGGFPNYVFSLRLGSRFLSIGLCETVISPHEYNCDE